MNACYHPPQSGRTQESEEAAPVPGKGHRAGGPSAAACKQPLTL